MSIFSFLKKSDKEKSSQYYKDYFVPKPDYNSPSVVDIPDMSFGMPSGNPIVLGHTHWSELDYGFRVSSATGTVAASHIHSGYSFIRCSYCGRKNRDENEFCSGCGAML